jgi:Kef-type K+ transport system membrane component KefB
MNDVLHQILLLFGMAMFLGLTGGKIFRHFRIPQVVGYITIGIILGISGVGIFDRDTIRLLGPFTDFALGLIGFMIGGEIKLSTFKKYGSKIITILLFEGIVTYIVVGLAVYAFTQNFPLAILLAALSAATAPAATVDVIWEYRAKGILATTIIAIVALDDGLSLILYALSKVFAESALTGKSFSILHSLAHPLMELGGSLIVGIGMGLVICLILKRIHEVKEREHFIVISLGAILVTCGIASTFNFDLILCNMILGTTLINVYPKRSQFLFTVTKQMASPVYVIFFVLIGARLNVATIGSMGAIGVVYLVFRTLGKISGSYLGARISGADEKVRKYLGTSLFSQAGVAIGLAIAIYQSFSAMGPQGEALGLLILNIITATTFVVQIIGPPSVKWSLKKAGEVGRAMSEEEVLDAHTVSDIMVTDPDVIHEGDSYNKVMGRLKHSEYVYFPVVDEKNNFKGAIQLDNIRSILFEEALTPLVRAIDMTIPDVTTVTPRTKLSEAKRLFEFEEYDYLPVLDGHKKLKGVLPRRTLMNYIKRKLWESEVG